MSETVVSPALLGISDVLVLTALERAFSRALPHGARRHIAAGNRHRGYELVSIPTERIEHALTDAWVLCPMMASRHQLRVDIPSWVELLHTYTSSLIMVGQPHAPSKLREVLGVMLDGLAAEDEDDVYGTISPIGGRR